MLLPQFGQNEIRELVCNQSFETMFHLLHPGVQKWVLTTGDVKVPQNGGAQLNVFCRVTYNIRKPQETSCT